jgi:putative phosphoribosyl transferase
VKSVADHGSLENNQAGRAQVVIIFQDRRQAGLALAQVLRDELEEELTAGDTIVLGLPRGGVPVAFEIAHGLHLPLDVFVVRKLGVPGQEELAMGAIASGAVILVDDGLATGSTMTAAVRALRPVARRVLVAVPVAAQGTRDELRREADRVICLETPDPFHAVGEFYRNFDQTTDDEVRAVLTQARTGCHAV